MCLRRVVAQNRNVDAVDISNSVYDDFVHVFVLNDGDYAYGVNSDSDSDGDDVVRDAVQTIQVLQWY